MVSKPTRTVSTTEFEAQCLAFIDEIAETGEEIAITRHGSVRARIIPEPQTMNPLPEQATQPGTKHDEDATAARAARRRAARRRLTGSVTYLGDIVSPLYPDYDPPAFPGELATADERLLALPAIPTSW